MLNVKLERYLNDFWRKVEAKSFASLSELENWIFDQMQQQVGNSVPVAIGEFIKRCILRILQAQRQVQFA